MIASTFHSPPWYPHFSEPPVTAAPITEAIQCLFSRDTLSLGDEWAMRLSHDISFWDIPTFHEGFYGKEARTRPQNISILSDYIFSYDQAESVNSFLRATPYALALLSRLPSIITKIYNGKAKKRVELITDPDTGSPLLEVCILTKLPLDDEFWKKDKQLYEEIHQASLEKGLEYVVLCQG